jgi:hypothetical protein
MICSAAITRMPNINWVYTLGAPRTRNVATTVVVLQQAVDPFRLAARLVALGFMRCKFDLLAPPGNLVDQRLVPLLTAL